MRCINAEDRYGPLRLAAADGGDHCGHPGLFFAAVGAFRGTGLAQRV
jgi:hypothetical protein